MNIQYGILEIKVLNIVYKIVLHCTKLLMNSINRY